MKEDSQFCMKAVASWLGGSSELPLPGNMSAADVQYSWVLLCLQPEWTLLKYSGSAVRAGSASGPKLSDIKHLKQYSPWVLCLSDALW